MTGVCIMRMERGLDTGPVYLRSETSVDRKTAGELTAELAALGGAMMVETLAGLDTLHPEPQPDEGVTYAAKVDKAETRLDFSRSAAEVERQVRAFNPSPGAWFEHQGERIRILATQLFPGEGRGPAAPYPGPRPAPGSVLDDGLAIACGEGAIIPTLVQRAGRAAMSAPELMRGFPIPKGTRLA